MKTSARNQFPGTVGKIKTGAVNDEIELEIGGGQTIVAIITHDSAVRLGLQTGAPAFALIKASSIVIVTDDQGAKFSTRNRLGGIVSSLHAGAVNSEVVIDLAGGGQVAAIVTNVGSAKLGLAVGQVAAAIFEASSVILGVAA